MRKLLVTLAAAVVLLAFGVSSAFAGGAGAEKAPLVHNVFELCTGGLINPPSPLPTGFGSAVINATDNKLIAEVALKNALPNTTYQVALTQTPSGAGCNVYTDSITTNGQGNGNVHIAQPLLPGTTDAFVDVVDFATFDFYNSPDVTIA
jgi:hypothetical protein